MVLDGRFDDIDEYDIETSVLEYKNAMMIPLYANIKGLVKKLKLTEVDRLFEELELVKIGLKKSIVDL